MHFHDLVLATVAFASEILGTLSGFGSSTFFVPLAVLIENFKFVLALTAILHCFGNLFKILMFRREFQWITFVKFAVPAFIFTGIGALLTTEFSVKIMERGLGLALIFVALLSLFTKLKTQSLPQWAIIALSAFSGFSTGFVGTGGAIRGVALTAMQLPKNSFVLLSSAIDIGGDLLRALIYLRNGYMDWSQWFYIPLLVLAALLGARVGKAMLNRINQTQFERLVAAFVFLSGLLMVVQP